MSSSGGRESPGRERAGGWGAGLGAAEPGAGERGEVCGLARVVGRGGAGNGEIWGLARGQASRGDEYSGCEGNWRGYGGWCQG